MFLAECQCSIGIGGEELVYDAVILMSNSPVKGFKLFFLNILYKECRRNFKRWDVGVLQVLLHVQLNLYSV